MQLADSYVLMTTGVEVVTFPDPSSEMLLLFAMSSTFSFFLFSGKVVKKVAEDDTVVLKTNWMLVAGTGESVDSTMLAVVLPLSATVVLVAVTAAEVGAGVAFF